MYTTLIDRILLFLRFGRTLGCSLLDGAPQYNKSKPVVLGDRIVVPASAEAHGRLEFINDYFSASPEIGVGCGVLIMVNAIRVLASWANYGVSSGCGWKVSDL